MKKKNVRSALLLCYAFVVSVYVLPQPGTVEKLSQAMTDSLAYLQMSVQQKNDAHGINKIAATSLLQLVQKAKQDPSFKGKALCQQVIAVMKERNTSLDKILSTSQKQSFQQHKVSNLADLQTKIMRAQLDLSDEQVVQVYPYNFQQSGLIIQNMQKLKGSNDRRDKMQAAKELKTQAAEKDKALKQILTIEQYATYEQNKHAMMEALKERTQATRG